ncbi:hypothetical protein BD769DRAFT_1529789 [Suillus cothurnatus]|nr:hypothetical protein BD769DRAFT_1529789 [Suillus cothurnatus]
MQYFRRHVSPWLSAELYLFSCVCQAHLHAYVRIVSSVFGESRFPSTPILPSASWHLLCNSYNIYSSSKGKVSR